MRRLATGAASTQVDPYAILVNVEYVDDIDHFNDKYAVALVRFYSTDFCKGFPVDYKDPDQTSIWAGWPPSGGSI